LCQVKHYTRCCTITRFQKGAGPLKQQSSSRHLDLALKIRKLTDRLIAIVDEGHPSPGLENELKEILAWLDNAGQAVTVRALRDRGSFGRYENSRILSEVVKEADRGTLKEKLNTVIAAPTEQQMKQSALEAIKYFDRIERRALFRHSHPPMARRFSVSK
jgi:hypothetical protein